MGKQDKPQPTPDMVLARIDRAQADLRRVDEMLAEARADHSHQAAASFLRERRAVIAELDALEDMAAALQSHVDADDPAALSDEEYAQLCEAQAEALPDHHLAIFSAAYLRRHKHALEVGPDGTLSLVRLGGGLRLVAGGG